jgi:hypothetical protein
MLCCLKYFRRKIAIFCSNWTAIFLRKFYRNIGFGEILYIHAKNCDHNIDPWWEYQHLHFVTATYQIRTDTLQRRMPAFHQNLNGECQNFINIWTENASISSTFQRRMPEFHQHLNGECQHFINISTENARISSTFDRRMPAFHQHFNGECQHLSCDPKLSTMIDSDRCERSLLSFLLLKRVSNGLLPLASRLCGLTRVARFFLV